MSTNREQIDEILRVRDPLPPLAGGRLASEIGAALGGIWSHHGRGQTDYSVVGLVVAAVLVVAVLVGGGWYGYRHLGISQTGHRLVQLQPLPPDASEHAIGTRLMTLGRVLSRTRWSATQRRQATQLAGELSGVRLELLGGSTMQAARDVDSVEAGINRLGGGHHG